MAVDGAAAGNRDIVPAAAGDKGGGRSGVLDCRPAGELKIDVAVERERVTEVGSGRDDHRAALIRGVFGGINGGHEVCRVGGCDRRWRRGR